jgi:multidrug efflux pump subunit AcrA (membrane-fusion protein)
MVRTILRVAVVAGVLLLGVVVMVGLVKSKPEAKKVDSGQKAAPVEVATVKLASHKARVPASGVVVPSRQVLLAAEVGGRVVQMHRDLVPGGRLPRGTQLLRIDARDYKLAVDQQYAQVDRAQTELELEKGRKRIAEREWELLGKSPTAPSGGGAAGGGAAGEGGNLALREPQLRTAEAAVKAAASGLERARLAVGKAALSVPFNALVQSRSVDIGQLVAPGAPLATLVGTDTFWVQVSVPVGRLAWIDVPGLGGAATGSPAVIRQRTGEGEIVRRGTVIRLLGDLDPAGRMARLLIEIDDPLGLSAGAEQPAIPLLIGAYVDVEIEGRELVQVAELPREALREGDAVYLVGPEDELEIRPVEVVWRQRDRVLVGKGLAAGDRVVLSPLPAPLARMKLKVVETTTTARKQ